MSLVVDGLSAGYGKALALHEVSLRLEDHELLAVLGPNGAGKSTLLQTLVGILSARSGSIHLDGVDMTTLPPMQRSALGISWVPEGRRLFPSLSVRENLQVAARRVSSDDLQGRMHEVLELFPDVANFLDRPAWALSGGQQQMVAVGRALMARPRVLLLDEPSLGLAPIIVTVLMDALRELNGRGHTMIVVEQNVVAGLNLASRAIVLSHGRIRYEGSPSELLNDDRVRNSYLSSSE